MRALVLVCCGMLACKPTQPEARSLVPPSEPEAAAFAKDFVTHIVPCSAAELDERIDHDLVLARVFANRKATSAEIKGFKRGFGSLGKILCRQLATDQNIAASYLRSRVVAGAPRPIVRLIMDGSLNYLELELDKQGDRVLIADLTSYMAGDRLTDIVGNTVDVFRSGIRDAQGLDVKARRINEHMLAGEWKQAHELYLTLSPKVRATKPLRLMEIRITGELGDDSYLAAMEAYEKAFPDDPSLALIAIDRAYLRKEYAEVRRHLDTLDRRVGGDPYIDVLRADLLAAEGKPAEALETATRATAAVPELVAAWWTLLTQQTANQRYTDALTTLAVLRDRFQQDVSAATLGSDERFSALAASGEYAAWAAR